MNAPIAEHLEQNMDNGAYPPDHHRRDDRSVNPDDVLAELLDGQQMLITAQHQFIHDRDMRALAAAQRMFVSCQTRVMQRLGVFG